jgi:hypothetical protein
MRLQRLTGLEREKVVEEYKELMALVQRLKSILSSDALVLQEIRAELVDLKERFGDARRTEIVPETNDITIEDMIADEDMVITSPTPATSRSLVRLIAPSSAAARAAWGCRRARTLHARLYIASAHSYILVFTERGQAHWLKVHQIPELAGCPRQGDRQPAQLDPRRRWHHGSGPFLRPRSLPVLRHRAGHRQEDRAARSNPGSRHHAPASKGDRLLDAASPRQRTRRHPQGLAIRFPRPTCDRWAGLPMARGIRRRAAIGSGHGRAAAAATFSPSPSAVTASAPRSTSTASRAAAAKASSTSRCRPRPARWSACSRSSPPTT